MRVSTAVSVYELDNLPGSSQVCVSHSMFVKPEHRGQGLADQEHKDRLAAIKDLGYDYAICTVDKSNAAQVHLLEKNGWTNLDFFWSQKTGHSVGIYGRWISRT